MKEYSTIEASQIILDTIKKEYNDLETLNIMLLGKTGVGKSTLVNSVFNKNIAKTGVGKPVTSEIRKYEIPDFPLAIFDTPGAELSGDMSTENLLNEVVDKIHDGLRSDNIKNAIHCIWYCINASANRIEQAEIDFLNKLTNRIKEYNVPIIVVLTQSISDKAALALQKEIEKENLPITGIIPVLAIDYEINDEYVVRKKGLDDLCEITNNVLPEVIRNTFVAIQSVNLQLKKDKAQRIIATAVASAAATAATPIPLADATLLVPEQILMLAKLTSLFGFKFEKATLMTFLSSTIGTAGATLLGRTVVSSLVKLIPGAGSIAGGMFSTATAGTITYALGMTYLKILIMISEGKMDAKTLSTPMGKKIIKDAFEKQLSRRKD